MGRRATVLSIWTGEIDATGLPEPLGLFLDPKTGKKKFFCPPGPPAGGQPLRAGYTGNLSCFPIFSGIFLSSLYSDMPALWPSVCAEELNRAKLSDAIMLMDWAPVPMSAKGKVRSPWPA